MNKLMKRFLKEERGFTLIELIVVIIILAILAGIAIPQYNKSRISAAITAHNSNVSILENAASMYLVDNDIAADETVIWDEEDNTSWTDYLRDWPEIASNIKGKEVSINGEIVTLDVYEVTIVQDGIITITPDHFTVDDLVGD